MHALDCMLARNAAVPEGGGPCPDMLETSMKHPLFEMAEKRPVIWDGAMGTEIQKRDPGNLDFMGCDGLNEILVLTHPDFIGDIHRAYLLAGADVIETDSFGSNPVVLAEYKIAHRTRELNREAALLARRIADEVSAVSKPRWVSGSMGPGTKLPSLGQITVAELQEGYREQVMGLLEGGVDLLQIETCQDPLQARAAVLGARSAMEAYGREVPIIVTVTVERQGTMLLGTEPSAAAATLADLEGVAAFGMNCATGPSDMSAAIRELARVTNRPLVILPNAGFPETIDGRMVYTLGPEEFAAQVADYVKDPGVAFVGGCCGTGPDHIRAIASAVSQCSMVRSGDDDGVTSNLSSLYSAVSMIQEPRPLLVGERTNANGSKVFRDLLAVNDYDAMVAVASSQADEGAHVLDVCLALAGRDEKADMVAFIPKLREAVSLPLMVDSTDPEAIEIALDLWPGRAVVNSVNLEDGGARLDRIARASRRHSAAVVALTIDEVGMAMTVDRKIEVGKRLVDLLVGKYGFAPQDILLDVLTFTLASGDESLRSAGINTLSALRRVKAELPGVLTSLGVSNISYGLKPKARRVLNSVFMHHAIEAGLDVAITNAGKILPLNAIDPELRALASDIVFDRRGAADPLSLFMDAFETRQGVDDDDGLGQTLQMDPEERLRRQVLRGDPTGLEPIILAVLANRSPLDVVNGLLLQAMAEVGELFGRGEMQLPFVLKSAQVMKTAVGILEPMMDRDKGPSRGTLVLATVAGDVHDIGKNLVDIILTNNGYRVVNLGIKQSVDRIIEAAREEKADAVGMSGLLVKSTLVMKENLQEMARRGLSLPVLLGGAALNRRFVENDLQPEYNGQVHYCKDAFDGLKVLGARAESTSAVSSARTAASKRSSPVDNAPVTRPSPVSHDVPTPSFMGIRVEKDLPLKEIARFVNRTSLFRGQWQFKRGQLSNDEWNRIVATKYEPMFQDRLARYEREGLLVPEAVWGILPANSDGDSVVVFDQTGETEVARFKFPRQQKAPFTCLADYLLPLSSSKRDLLGVQIVTLGPEISRAEALLNQAGDYQEYFYLHGVGVELAEATAEWVHARVRSALGIGSADDNDVQALIKMGYRGARYSFGYPACPNLEDQVRLLQILGAERIGVSLTEQFQMVPEQSTSAIVFHAPQAVYFSV